MIALRKNPRTDEVKNLMKLLEDGRVKLLDLEDDALKLPRYVSRDEVLYGLAQRAKELRVESVRAGKLFSRSLSKSSAKVGFQGRFESLKKDIQKRYRSAQRSSFNRVKSLAKAEIKEIKEMLQKMHIVEAEVIQQVALAKRVAKDTKGMQQKHDGRKLDRGKYALSFPFEGETWFDELSNYRIDIKKGCVAKAGGK